MLVRRSRRVANPVANPEGPVTDPIFVLSSDPEDSNDLAFVLLHPKGEDVIEHSYSEGNGPDSSSGEVNKALKFKTLRQKKTQASVEPSVVPDRPIVQHSPPVQNAVLTFTKPGVVEESLSEAPLLDKCKRKQFAKGPLKRYKKKGEAT